MESDTRGSVRWWQHWQLTVLLSALCIGLATSVWVLNNKVHSRERQLARLQQHLETGSMEPPSDLRSIRVSPERGTPSGPPQLSLRMPDLPDLVELRINVSFARQNAFRVLIDRENQARAGIVHNLLRDSNGDLRLSINTSALHPGIYRITIEGLVNRRNPVPVGWIGVRVIR